MHKFNQTPYTVLRPFRHGLAHQLLCIESDTYISRSLALYGEYSEGEVDVFRHFIREDDVCMDLGALFGEFTIPMAQLCPRGMVFAFEPQRVPYQILCGNCQLNSIFNVECLRIAVGAGEGMTTIPALNPLLDQPWGGVTVESGIGDRVRVRALDDMGLTRLDFIKMDIEGTEHDALRGARETIRFHQPVIYLEFNWHREEIIDELLGMGYGLAGIDANPGLFTHHALMHREGNWLNAPVPPLVPASHMLLAVPPKRISELSTLDGNPDWLALNHFRPVTTALEEEEEARTLTPSPSPVAVYAGEGNSPSSCSNQYERRGN
jgi:FkbM family methyltransferase